MLSHEIVSQLREMVDQELEKSEHRIKRSLRTDSVVVLLISAIFTAGSALAEWGLSSLCSPQQVTQMLIVIFHYLHRYIQQ